MLFNKTDTLVSQHRVIFRYYETMIYMESQLVTNDCINSYWRTNGRFSFESRIYCIRQNLKILVFTHASLVWSNTSGKGTWILMIYVYWILERNFADIYIKIRIVTQIRERAHIVLTENENLDHCKLVLPTIISSLEQLFQLIRVIYKQSYYVMQDCFSHTHTYARAHCQLCNGLVFAFTLYTLQPIIISIKNVYFINYDNCNRVEKSSGHP